MGTQIQVMAEPKQKGESFIKSNKRYAEFECPACNKNYVTRVESVLNGKSTKCKSCAARLRSTKHGMYKTRIYQCWSDMKQRCYNPKAVEFKRYGEKGVIVHHEWINSFENFFSWAKANGYKEWLTIDRINSNGNYEPQNCRWVDKETQSCNQSIGRLNKSGYIGVFKVGKRWFAQIKHKYKNIYVGSFDCPIKAAKARNKYIMDNGLPHTLCEIGEAE